MSSKRKSGAKRTPRRARAYAGPVWRQSAEEATLAQNPRYNGFACGHGAHGDRKFNRAKANRAWKAQLRQEGASRGSFPFFRGTAACGDAADAALRFAFFAFRPPSSFDWFGELATSCKIGLLFVCNGVSY